MRLKCTIEGALEEIKKETGFVGFIVVGGPEPKFGGDLMIMSCVPYSSCVAATIFIIPRAHTGDTGLGLNFGQVHTGWKSGVEEPFLAYLNKVFSTSLFFYMLTFVNCHLAREVRQSFALSGTTSTQNPPTVQPNTSHINPDATKFTGTLETEPGVGGYDLGDLIGMLDDKNLISCGDPNNGSQG